MGRLFWVDEDNRVADGYGGRVNASHRWGLPGLRDCPGCGETWSSSGHAYPSVDLSLLEEHREFEGARPEPYPEFMRLRELVRPLAPSGDSLPPGTEFGPLEGKALGKYPSFAWLGSSLLVHHLDLESLQEAGLKGLVGCPTALTARQKPVTDLLELEVLPRGALHPDCFPPDEAPPCSTCGRLGLSRPDEPLLDAASLPTALDLFRVGNFATMVIGTERFKEAVEQLGLDGLTFRELPTR
ncbi:Myxococcus xanthus double-CXXCG motif paralogous family [Myxococcus fulvus]|uniref:Myxococcus xanthus double-CXXCG motif paralogous family n=1 Tax=Myxococcus fulvus TaxID=33 RepID=A0A511T970_MYXFU|nr:double-CXXCG motif protein [Myxococcus fulvus]GEN10725.1 hypothetical protein MFU01_57620 [Myxococcus fulvus]SEU37759.1 Myxococcus xanthus double-CXXCG motif paralogous family [Myxococcus fulvus]